MQCNQRWERAVNAGVEHETVMRNDIHPSETRVSCLQRMTADITLESLVSHLTTQVQTHFHERLVLRPKALKKRIFRLIDAALPPYRRPAGRPKLNRITTATAMYERQKAEVKAGTRKTVNWQQIGQECIPGFERIKSRYRRQAEFKRLRDAVHARLGRNRKGRAGQLRMPPPEN